MFATLSEAFGQNYDEYPPSDLQQKRKKKNMKGKTYGCETPQNRFTSPEPKKELNLTIGGYPEDDDNYLKISNENEYGPTDYNIKPKDIEEYTYQMKKNYIDDNTNTNIINRKLGTPSASNDPNIIEDNYDNNYAMFKNIDQQSNKNKSMNSFNNLDMNVDISEENENEGKKKSMKYDPRLADFNAKLDLILQKLGHMEEPVQENIHDIILFVIFGVFVIFILDSVYRVGKMTL